MADPTDTGHSGLRLIVYVSAASAVASVVLSAWLWLLAFFAIGFTWQATVAWCAYRYQRDGHNVWERSDG